MLHGIRLMTIASLFSISSICSVCSISTLTAQHLIDNKYYPNPGIVGLDQNKMTGSDHLLNISSNIPVVVEIFKPEDAKIDLTREHIHEVVSKVFSNQKIDTKDNSSETSFNLPFFHVLIMLYPLPNGYAVSCQGRLFEQVELKRVQLDEGTAIQAITWESQNLIITPAKELVNQVTSSIEEIAKTFTTRYAFYLGIEESLKKGTNIHQQELQNKPRPEHRPYKETPQEENRSKTSSSSSSTMHGSGSSGSSGGGFGGSSHSSGY